MFDVITIGSATLDVFIESDSANIVSVSSKDKRSDFMSFPYGSKVEIDDFTRSFGGGGINTAMNFAHLGLKTSTIVKLGYDEVSPVICEKLVKSNVDTSNVIMSKEGLTGFSIILVSFQGDRTVLAHRGVNSSIKEKDVDFDRIKNTKWLYIAPLAGDTNKMLDKLASFAKENNIKLSINAGTTAIKKGEKYFSKIIETADILVLNKEEASMLTKIFVRPDTKNEKFSNEFIHPDVIKMLGILRGKNEVNVVITDGKAGVYAYDGNKFYKAPQFPAKVRSTLGAGDAFSSSFTAAMERYDMDIKKSLSAASVNAASVVESFGAQEGFLTFNEIEEKLKNTPDFTVEEKNKAEFKALIQE